MRKFKIIISILLALTFLLTAFTGVVLFYHRATANSRWEQEYLGIVVCGEFVTRKNAADILGDGTVQYDIFSNILTLSNACLDYNGSAAIFAEKDLTISLDGENSISCTGAESIAAIYASNVMLREDISFIGAGSLSIEGNGNGDAIVAGIVADDICACTDVSIDISDAAEASVGIECSYLCLTEGSKVSVKIDSIGEASGIYVRGDIDLFESVALDVANVNAGVNCMGIECTGSINAGEGSTISSTSGEDKAGILCHNVFFDYGATVNSEIDAIGGIRYGE